MDEPQDAHEIEVGLQFIASYNKEHGTNFTLVGRADPAPDLVFRDGDCELKAEIASAYYDVAHAQFKWMAARRSPDAPRVWTGAMFEQGLIDFINDELKDKCSKDYGKNCVLVISVSPTVTTRAHMAKLLEDVS